MTLRPPLPHSLRHCLRTYTTQSTSPLLVFNDHAKWLQKERAARDPLQSRRVDYLRNEVARRLCDRLLDINRPFPHALDLGAHACHIARALAAQTPQITHLTAAESSAALLHRDALAELPFTLSRTALPPSFTPLPFAPGAYDVVLSSLALHWVNDLPLALAQIHALLKPDAPFIGAMLGGDTLFELRTALQLAEQERRGGLAPRVSPFADVRDVGSLLGRAGFRLLTVDVDDIVVGFPSVVALLRDLQDMGESGALVQGEGPLGRETVAAAEGIYRELHGEGEELPATFRVVYMIGWREGEDTPRPRGRGSGVVSLKEVLEGRGEGR
ncbi:MAG: hypothetical protein M1829_005131 [Trizodia sp. TS-e1964]|nr:MAG: hypothetical protein M1829_005131 [Trizodia sp. TS-e1964]